MRNFIEAKQFCEHITDGTHDSPHYIKKGYPLITSKYIMNGHIITENVPLISKADFDQVNLRSKVKIGDVLFSMIGTVGEVAIVKQHPNFAIKNMGLFRCKNMLDANILYYYLQSSYAKQKNREFLSGSTQQYITLSNLKTYPILDISTNNKQHIVNTL